MLVGRPSSRDARSIFADATALRRRLRLWLTKAAGSVCGCTQAGCACACSGIAGSTPRASCGPARRSAVSS
eukprot:9192457-Pyramimonas_sp.AAC.1